MQFDGTSHESKTGIRGLPPNDRNFGAIIYDANPTTEVMRASENLVKSTKTFGGSGHGRRESMPTAGGSFHRQYSEFGKKSVVTHVCVLCLIPYKQTHVSVASNASILATSSTGYDRTPHIHRPVFKVTWRPNALEVRGSVKPNR